MTATPKDKAFEAMRKALKLSASGWSNGIELEIIPSQHVISAQSILDEANSALALADKAMEEKP
jgi:hypothetical protein